MERTQNFKPAFTRAIKELAAHTPGGKWTKRAHWIWVIFPQDDGGGTSKSGRGLGFPIGIRGKYNCTARELQDSYINYVRTLRELGPDFGPTYIDTWCALVRGILNYTITVGSDDVRRVEGVKAKLYPESLLSLVEHEEEMSAALEASKALCGLLM